MTIKAVIADCEAKIFENEAFFPITYFNSDLIKHLSFFSLRHDMKSNKNKSRSW